MMDKITQALLRAFSDENDISNLDQSKQFEHFVNYCVISKLYRNTFEVDSIETGDGGDGAIDGLAIIVNGYLIEEEEEFLDILNSSKFLDCDIVFIQSKTSSKFEGSQIGNFIFGVKDFISDEPKLVHNEKLKEKKMLWEKIIENSQYMHNRLPRCRLYYATTGSWQNDKNLLGVSESGSKEIKDSHLFEEVDFKYLGADEIRRLYQETKNKLSVTITFQNRVTFPDINGVDEAYMGCLPFGEFLKLIQDESGHLFNIFDENIRDFLGDNEVNKKIGETLNQGKFELFSILNNGITIVAASVTLAGNRFTLRDFQVVNGCQTSNVLYDLQNLDGINNVHIPIRIIVTAEDDVKSQVTVATNSQTAVKPEEIESLSQFQKNLEIYYMSMNDSTQLFYERRSRQYHSDTTVKKTQVITISSQIKTFAAAYLKVPHAVSGYYGTIIKNFGDKIFNSNHKFAPYLASALCYSKLEASFRNSTIDKEYRKLRFHLIMLARIISDKQAPDVPFNSRDIERQALEFIDVLNDDERLLEIFNQAIEVCKVSGIDLRKRQFKSESETELLIRSVSYMYS